MSFPTFWLIVTSVVVNVVGLIVVATVEKYQKRKALERLKDYLNSDLKALEYDAANKERKIHPDSTSVSSAPSKCPASTSDSGLKGGSNEEEVFFDCEEEIPASSFLEIDRKLDHGTEKDIVNVLHVLEKFPLYKEDIEIIWRIAKVCSLLIEYTDNNSVKKEYINKGVNICECNVLKYKDCFEIQKWYAVLIGQRASIKPIRESISDARLFIKQSKIALSLKSDDYLLNHGFGRLYFELASLNWFKRKAAEATLDLSSCTFQKALDYFLIAEKFRKSDLKENKLYIAKCYSNLGMKTDEIKWLRKADDLKINSPMDLKIQQEIQGMFEKFEF